MAYIRIVLGGVDNIKFIGKLTAVLLTLWVVANVFVWYTGNQRPDGTYSTYIGIFNLLGQVHCVVLIYFAMECYTAYRARPFLYLVLLALSMFVATSANLYITPRLTHSPVVFGIDFIALLFFYGLAGLLFIIVNKKVLDAVTPTKVVLFKERQELPLREDIALFIASADLTNNLLRNVMPMIGTKGLTEIFTKLSAEHELLGYCHMVEDGTLVVDDALAHLNLSDEAESTPRIVRAFSQLNNEIIDVYSSVASRKLATQTIKNLIKQMKAQPFGKRDRHEILQRHGMLLRIDPNEEKSGITSLLFERLLGDILKACSPATIAELGKTFSDVEALKGLALLPNGAVDIRELKTSKPVEAFATAIKMSYPIIKRSSGRRAETLFSEALANILRVHGDVLYRHGIIDVLPEGITLYGGLKLGRTYVVEEPKPDKSFQLFTALVSYGLRGLLITRMHPDIVREKYGKFDEVKWLTKSDEADALTPTNLVVLAHTIEGFLKEAGSAVALLDGLEYLMLHRDFQTVLKLIEDVNDIVMTQKCILVLPVNPGILSKKELELLKRNTEFI